jgi:hypothetical protein
MNMKATKEMLTSIRLAVRRTEQAWDAQRDFELEANKDFDRLSEWIGDLAVMGAEHVTLQMVQEFLDEDLVPDEEPKGE